MFENTSTSLEPVVCSDASVVFDAATTEPHDYDETGNLFHLFVNTVGA